MRSAKERIQMRYMGVTDRGLKVAGCAALVLFAVLVAYIAVSVR